MHFLSPGTTRRRSPWLREPFWSKVFRGEMKFGRPSLKKKNLRNLGLQQKGLECYIPVFCGSCAPFNSVLDLFHWNWRYTKHLQQSESKIYGLFTIESALLGFFILALINQTLKGHLQTLYPEKRLYWFRRTIWNLGFIKRYLSLQWYVKILKILTTSSFLCLQKMTAKCCS